MSGPALAVAVGAVVLASLAAAADGALLGGDPDPEPAQPGVADPTGPRKFTICVPSNHTSSSPCGPRTKR